MLERSEFEFRSRETDTDPGEVEALRQTLKEQTEHLDALNDQLVLMADREAKWQAMLVDARKQALGGAKLEALVEERTRWAQQLAGEVATRDSIIRDLQSKLEEITAWALRLADDVARRDATIRDLERRPAWARPAVSALRASNALICAAFARWRRGVRL